MIPILGEERTVYSADEVKEMLNQSLQQQAERIMNDQFVSLYFACIQLGFSERIKAHRSWSNDVATGLAEQAHQTVTAAFERLGKSQREKQAMLEKAMAEADRRKRAKDPTSVEATGQTGPQEAACAAGCDCSQEQPPAAEKPAGEAT